MTDLDTIVGKFRKASPNVAAAFDEVQRRLALLEKPPVVVTPPPVTPPVTPPPAGWSKPYVTPDQGTITPGPVTWDKALQTPARAVVKADGTVDVTVVAGDSPPPWGGQRAEWWPNPHAHPGEVGAISEGEKWGRAWSMLFPSATFKVPTWWGAAYQQIHSGDEGSPGSGLYVRANGSLVFWVRDGSQDFLLAAKVPLDQRIYLATEILHKTSGGTIRLWWKIGSPPDVQAAPSKTWSSAQTAFPGTVGQRDWDKYGVYASPGDATHSPSPTSTVNLGRIAKQTTVEQAAALAWA